MSQRDIVIAVTGGVAAFKAAALTSQLVQSDFGVSVVQTQSAQRFVGNSTFEALTGKPVATEVFDSRFPLGTHIELSRSHDLLCVVPATANFLAKAANGNSDDLVSTLYLCFSPHQVIVAPAMNCEMWDHPAVRRNVEQLKNDGVTLIDPQEGWLSCRQKGVGRMAPPEEILEVIKSRSQ